MKPKSSVISAAFTSTDKQGNIRHHSNLSQDQVSLTAISAYGRLVG